MCIRDRPNIGVPSGTAQHKEAVINPPDRFGIGIKRAAVISPKVLRFLRYTGVNLASTVVDYAFFLTLTHFFGMPIMQSIIAYSLALMVNFTLTRTYVFCRRHVAQERTSRVRGVRGYRTHRSGLNRSRRLVHDPRPGFVAG